MSAANAEYIQYGHSTGIILGYLYVGLTIHIGNAPISSQVSRLAFL